MRPGQDRFVTACQQLLVLGAVLAVLTPAASVISLDIVGGGSAEHTRGRLQAEAIGTDTAQVPTQVVDPVVKEYALTPPAGQGTLGKTAQAGLHARLTGKTKAGAARMVTDPLPVTGFGTIGITWATDATAIPEQAASFEVRTRTGEVWSEWSTLPYDPDHAPDPDSREGRHARPGTDPVLVGDVDDVQVRETTTATLPADMKMAVIDPGAEGSTAVEKAAIDTSTLDAPDADLSGAEASAAGAAGDTALDTPSTSTPGAPDDNAAKGPVAGEGALALRATTYTPKPQIFSRAQWGADESMRSASSLRYFEVHAGFVHHTVNANTYTRAQVPALIRGIYAYHVRSRGWSDIGYNFLVDRFGRIWEGRYGGVDRPVVGAHTLGYNDYSFAMSAIGNFDLVQPPKKMLRAYGRLFAWKLSLHGVDASSTRQQVGPTMFQAINGHRDAAATACPGKYLYAKLPRIRELAAHYQQGWSGRERQTDLASTDYPDLIARRSTDDHVMVIPTGGVVGFASQRLSASWAAGDTVVASPDLTGDGRGDVVVRGADGRLSVYPGDGDGGFDSPVGATKKFVGRDQITAVGDLDEDGRNDLVAREPGTGRLDAYLGKGNGRFKRHRLSAGWGDYRSIAGAGDLDGDHHVDLVGLSGDGRLLLRRGTGRATFGSAVALTGTYTSYDAITGLGDYDRDGRPDLLATKRSGAVVVLPADGTGYGHALGPYPRLAGRAGLSGADLAGTGQADVLARRGSRYVLFANRGAFNLGRPIDTGLVLPKVNALLNVGDWDRDGHDDLVVRKTNGALVLRRGDGDGHFGKPSRIGTRFGSVRLLSAVGDMTGDGYPDLMGQPRGGAMRIYPGAGTNGLRPSYVAYGPIDAGRQVGVGRWNTDGAPDSLFRKGRALRMYPGNGPGGLVNAGRTLDIDLRRYDWVLGLGNLTGSPHADLLVRQRATGDLWVLPGRASGFGKRQFLGSGLGAYNLVG
ncbi:MAG: FG-GAP-like repeat-containing protein [Nocardioides sp.]|uniref:FG-GAP-like repeat-containing protein n=1 Tax=Nocardioides sp. TaxID=35761 RepID=UPI0039E55E12